MLNFSFHYKKDLPNLEVLQTTEIDGKRHYISPSGNLLPSVTTVLSAFNEGKFSEWEEAVGKSEAERIRNKAARRGTEMHSVLEDFLNNKPIDFNSFMPDLKEKFLSMKDVLVDNITRVYYNEACLYSEKLGIAGRADLVAEWNGIPAIVDFKNASNMREDWEIESYLLQTTAYSLMLEERTGVRAELLQILIVGDKHLRAQVVSKHRREYIEPLMKVIAKWKSQSM